LKDYKIFAKKTTDLTEKDWSDYIDSFNLIFNKKKDIKYFKNKYLLNFKGFSVHGILSYKDTIVGMVTMIPNNYLINDFEQSVALTCDAFILSEHRKNENFLKKMALEVFDFFKKYDVKRYISIPNPTAYPYWKYFVKWKDIGGLDYYIIPLKISKILKLNYFPDTLVIFSYKFLSFIFSNSLFFSKSYTLNKIRRKRDDDYYKNRFIENYHTKLLSDGVKFIYKTYNENGIITVYIIDIFPQSKRTISMAIDFLINNLKIDILIFIGKIKYSPFYFVKVPKNKEPRIQPFIGFSLIKDDHDFFNINNWDVSLANFDNR
jgi:hypothetical protein